MAYNSKKSTLSTDMTGYTPDRVACVAGRIVMPVVLFFTIGTGMQREQPSHGGFFRAAKPFDLLLAILRLPLILPPTQATNRV